MREKKEFCKSIRMCGQFVQDMPETTDGIDAWKWLRKADLKVLMEALLCVAQEQAL